jgi:hypothetical protein
MAPDPPERLRDGDRWRLSPWPDPYSVTRAIAAAVVAGLALWLLPVWALFEFLS